MQNFIQHVIEKHIVHEVLFGEGPGATKAQYVSWDSVYDELMDAIPNATHEDICLMIQEAI